MKELAKLLGVVAVAGFVIVGAGRAAEWLIPKPETRIIFCFSSNDMEIDVCKTAAEILKK